MLVNATSAGVSRRPNSTERNTVLPLDPGAVALSLQAPEFAVVNTQEWLDTAGNVMASMSQNGDLTTASLVITGLSGVLLATAGIISDNATTSELSEGSNLYYTDERVDDRVAALLVAGTNITLTYDDGLDTLTIDATGGGSVTGTAGRITVTAGVVDIDATYVGQASIITLGTITTGTWSATAIGPTKGGTGQTSYLTGDLLYASASNVLSKRAAGTAGDVLTMAAGVPTWSPPAAGGLSQAQVYAAALSF